MLDSECVEVFGPGIKQGDYFLVDQSSICLEYGRLVQHFEGQISLPCGCGKNQVPCLPCPIPKQNLTISWVNPFFGNGSDTLVYGNNVWQTGCSGGGGNQLIFLLQCYGGDVPIQIQLQVIYFVSGSCPTGQRNFCSNIGSVGRITLSKYDCSSFMIVFTVNTRDCPDIAGSGYTSFIITL